MKNLTSVTIMSAPLFCALCCALLGLNTATIAKPAPKNNTKQAVAFSSLLTKINSIPSHSYKSAQKTIKTAQISLPKPAITSLKNNKFPPSAKLSLPHPPIKTRIYILNPLQNVAVNIDNTKNPTSNSKADKNNNAKLLKIKPIIQFKPFFVFKAGSLHHNIELFANKFHYNLVWHVVDAQSGQQADFNYAGKEMISANTATDILKQVMQSYNVKVKIWNGNRVICVTSDNSCE